MTVSGGDRQGRVLAVTGGWLRDVCTALLLFSPDTESLSTVMHIPVETRPRSLALLSLESLSLMSLVHSLELLQQMPPVRLRSASQRGLALTLSFILIKSLVSFNSRVDSQDTVSGCGKD